MAVDDAGGPEPSGLPAPRWGLGDVAIGLVPFVLGAVGTLSVALSGDEPDPVEVVSVGALLANSILIWLFIVGVPVVATTRKGNGLAADLGLRFRPADLWAFPLGAALQASLFVLYLPILELLDRTQDDVEGEARRIVDGASGAGIVLLVLIVCVGAPFAEELFFHGLTQRALLRRAGPVVALVGTTVSALSHLQGIQLPALLLFGAVAGFLAHRTGRLWPSILCHAGFNAFSVFTLLAFD